MFEMREVEVFLAVADQLHFGRTAEQLHVTPSSISQTIRTLERRIGGPLFERTSRRVLLTPLGRQLEAKLRPAFGAMRRAFTQAQAAANGPVSARLRVGYPATMPSSTLEVLTAAYVAEHPSHRLSWMQDRLLDVYSYRAGTEIGLDVLLGWIPPGQGPFNENLTMGPAIRSTTPALVVAADHPLAGRRFVDIEEMPGYPVLLPGIVAELGVQWVPAATPAGRPLNLVTRDNRHLESLLSAALDEGLVHMGPAELYDSPAWNLVRGTASLVPVTGLPPFTLRPFWPCDGIAVELAADFATLARRAGQAAGWLTPGDA